jgi:hypothetical protein
VRTKKVDLHFDTHTIREDDDMDGSAKCPKCQQLIANLVYVSMPAFRNTASLRAVTLCCPLCGTIIGAQLDPNVIADGIKSDIKKLR